MATKTASRTARKERVQPTRVTSVRGKLTSKGQITIPLEVRKRLGLRVGDEVDFIFEKDRTVLRPARSKENPFAKWVGAGRGAFKGDTDSIRWQREMRGYDEWDEKDLKQ